MDSSDKMSEQPPQEWTPERLAQYANPDHSDLNQLASAINAALAAAPPNRKADEEWSKLITELAAERGRNKIQSDALKLAYQELDAEREKHKTLTHAFESERDLRKRYENQLKLLVDALEQILGRRPEVGVRMITDNALAKVKEDK